MKINRSMIVSLAAVCFAGYGSMALADAKAKFGEICSECHEPADFEGEDAAALTATIQKIVKKEVKHKKALTLTDAEAAELAAFMSKGGK